MRKPQTRQAAFTLTELLITVAIIAILLAVAYPGYQEQVQSARRSDAKAELMRLAQYMERIYTEHGCYDPGTGDEPKCGTGSPIDTDDDGNLPSRIGVDGDGGGYRFRFVDDSLDGTSFTIRATPVEGGVQDGDGFLQIDELGQRFWDQNDNDDIKDAGENDWEKG
jgi:type IV pilus assembly protein PilE